MKTFQCDADWWRTAFDKEWQVMFSHKHKDAPKEACAIQKMLGLPLRSKILDLCCGDGRIALRLARLGYDVTGLDLSQVLIQAAQRKAEQAKLQISWLNMDMRDIEFSDRFDAIISVSTSFGYFSNESDNIRTLHSAANTLRKDGRLLLDLENVYYLAYMSRIYGTTPTYQPLNRFKCWLEEATDFDPISHTVKMRLRLWRRGRMVKDLGAKYRVYSLPEIRDMLESCGFHICSIFGDFDLQSYSILSPRMIIICEKT